MKKLILPLLLGVATFIWWQWGQSEAAKSAELTLYGNVDIREVQLGFRVGGRIDKLLVDEGDTVKAGDVLATLDTAPLQYDADQAAALTEAADEKLSMFENGYRHEDLDQAKAALAEAEASVVNARQQYDRQIKLVTSTAISRQDIDEAKADLDVKSARVTSAKAAIALLVAGYRPEEIAQAKAALSQAKAAAEAARLRLDDAHLRAPSDGVIITRAAEPGTVVNVGATVLSLSLESPVWARVYIDGAHLGDIHPGLEVDVFTDSRPDKPYHGKIGFISPQAEFTPKTVETTELRPGLVYRLRIVISDTDAALRQGMPVTVKLHRSGE